MKRVLTALALSAPLVTPAISGATTATWMCQVGHSSYPVTLTAKANGKANSRADGGYWEGGTITWRGRVFRNIKLVDECKVKFTATRNGVTIALCAATQGVADLSIGKDDFDCQDDRDRK
jgi:hypothetical protein